jgi:predicted PurR-regulated permease PerM
LTVFLVGVSGARLARRLPAYESQLAEIHDSLASSLSARGVDLPDPRTIEALSPQRLVGYAASVLGALASAFSDAILILLVVFMLAEGGKALQIRPGLAAGGLVVGAVLERRRRAQVRVHHRLHRVSGRHRKFHSSARPRRGCVALWAFLSFLFNFIPNFGFILSVIRPLFSLLEFGPGRAVVVVVGFILVNAVVENVLKPRFIGQELELSALAIFLSLLFWAGSWGRSVPSSPCR